MRVVRYSAAQRVSARVKEEMEEEQEEQGSTRWWENLELSHQVAPRKYLSFWPSGGATFPSDACGLQQLGIVGIVGIVGSKGRRASLGISVP